MDASQIIAKFRVYVDDDSQLSSSEELDLLNDTIDQVITEYAWTWIRKTYTGTMSTSVPYVSLPSDFAYILANHNHDSEPEAVVFVGSDYEPYRIVDWSERRNYRDRQGFACIDTVNSRLEFTKQPTEAKAIEFDYAHHPAALTATSETPIIPSRFHKILVHGMAIDHHIIEQSEKARSYLGENAAKYEQILNRMKLADSQNQLIQGY